VLRDTDDAASAARKFALRLGGWSLALFGLFRLPWVATQVLWPATRLQAAAAVAVFGPSSAPIEVTLACSGADALSLCLGAIVAYPASWRVRAAGVAMASTGLLALNTLRIGTLGRAASSPRLFDALHLYVWPAVLTAAIAGIVFAWMRVADRHREATTLAARPRLIVFGLTAGLLLLLFTLAAPWYLENARVLAGAMLIARGAAAMLRGIGMDATASAGLLTTPRGVFLVTQECIATPLIPIYVAAVLVYSRTWARASIGAAAAVPLFFALGMARLLVVALPPGITGSPAVAIHAFSQFLVAAGMVCGVAVWRHGARRSTWVRAGVALALALVCGRLLGGPYTRAIGWLAAPSYTDPQGALVLLPAFQAALLLALWIAAFVRRDWPRVAASFALLAAVQVAAVGALGILTHAALIPAVRDIRAWALLGPALVLAMVIHRAPARR
jgi:exosortase/archaeosortase family protein